MYRIGGLAVDPFPQGFKFCLFKVLIQKIRLGLAAILYTWKRGVTKDAIYQQHYLGRIRGQLWR